VRLATLVLVVIGMAWYSYLFVPETNGPQKFEEQPGDHLLAKDDPVFMESMESIKDSAPHAYRLVMKKVQSGATVREIKDYIYDAD